MTWIRSRAEYGLGPFRFPGFRVVRLGFVRGLHQREAMALPVHLVRLRLRDPYKGELS